MGSKLNISDRCFWEAGKFEGLTYLVLVKLSGKLSCVLLVKFGKVTFFAHMASFVIKKSNTIQSLWCPSSLKSTGDAGRREDVSHCQEKSVIKTSENVIFSRSLKCLKNTYLSEICPCIWRKPNRINFEYFRWLNVVLKFYSTKVKITF